MGSELDRLLPLWILLAMAAGLLLGRVVPNLQAVLGAVTVGQTSVPIALGLLMMLYPVLAKVRYGELGVVLRDRRLLTLALALVWGLGPLLMFGLAWWFLPDQAALRTGLIRARQDGRWIYYGLEPASLLLLRDWLGELAVACQSPAPPCS